MFFKLIFLILILGLSIYLLKNPKKIPLPWSLQGKKTFAAGFGAVALMLIIILAGKMINHVEMTSAEIIEKARIHAVRGEKLHAKHQLITIKEEDSLYTEAQALLAKVDSIVEAKNFRDRQNEISSSKEDDRFMPGVMPVDAYLNYEKSGFETDFQVVKGATKTYKWVSELTTGGIYYRITTYSTDQSKIETIEATCRKQNAMAIFDPSIFFMVASIPYDGADQQRNADWGVSNFHNDNAWREQGGVRFDITVPSSNVRILTISKMKSE